MMTLASSVYWVTQTERRREDRESPAVLTARATQQPADDDGCQLSAKAESSISALDIPVERAWSEVRNRLLTLRRYRRNWDGMGADAPDPLLVDTAIDYLGALRQQGMEPPHRIALSPNGAVVMEWQGPSQRRELEISDPFRAEWMLSRTGHPTRHWEDLWQRESDIASGAAVSGSAL